MRIAVIIALLCASAVSTAQQPALSAAQIQLELEKLNTVGRVLYIAAHPDDENTRLISWLANEQKVETAYLSLTRGDGGQNLIGTEKGALMGTLRTQELMEARKIDGGRQFFTRAVDFGYSKSAEETLEKWGKEEVLADVVFVIRQFKPDVIITRFPTDNYGGHGHHIASALLANEAFDAAANPEMFPGQLKNAVSVWQPKRLMFNSSSWWDKELPEKAKNSDEYVTIDIGEYNPLLGKSYSEIAAESRSQHKSQGFGAAKHRGSHIEYLQFVKGEKPKDNNLFSGIDLNWSRVAHMEAIAKDIQKVVEEYNPSDPAASVKPLAQLHQAINNKWWSLRVAKQPNDIAYVTAAQQRIKELALACAGGWLEATAESFSATPGEKVKLTAEAINRSKAQFKWQKATFSQADTALNLSLNNNELVSINKNITLAGAHSYTNQYWLEQPYENLFTVNSYKMLGKPQSDPALEVTFHLQVEGVPLFFKRPVLYRWTDRVEGELYRPFIVLPPVTLKFDKQNYLVTDEKEMEIAVTVQAHANNIKGELYITAPASWQAKEAKHDFAIAKKGTEKRYVFHVTPGEKDVWVPLNATAKVGDKAYTQELVEIEHPHIQTQAVLLPAKAKLVKFDVKTIGSKVGYIMGAGDDVPQAIQQLGYTIEMLQPENIPATNLTQYDAIVAGIRLYNTKDEMANAQPYIMEYVKNGGAYIVQYNTSRGIAENAIGPYPIHLSRDRVTVEEAPATILNNEHPLLNTPNKITKEDFNGWVQERGLYFADKWDEQYTPLLSWNDPGEEAKKGSLLVTEYGKGTFVFTGISFFRQLPAGVPGAYRLFANILSYRKK